MVTVYLREAERMSDEMPETPNRTQWRPGLPITSKQDDAEWQAWRRERILELQRERRRSLRRIDYYPSKGAFAVIDALRHNHAGGDASSIINRIIDEWATDRSGIK